MRGIGRTWAMPGTCWSGTWAYTYCEWSRKLTRCGRKLSCKRWCSLKLGNWHIAAKSDMRYSSKWKWGRQSARDTSNSHVSSRQRGSPYRRSAACSRMSRCSSWSRGIGCRLNSSEILTRGHRCSRKGRKCPFLFAWLVHPDRPCHRLSSTLHLVLAEARIGV